MPLSLLEVVTFQDGGKLLVDGPRRGQNSLIKFMSLQSNAITAEVAIYLTQLILSKAFSKST